MKETVIELQKKLDDLTEKWANIDKASEALEKIGGADFFVTKRIVLEELRTKSKELSNERQSVITAIGALQKVCSHKNPDGSSAFRGSGHDSHYSYCTCDICAYETKC